MLTPEKIQAMNQVSGLNVSPIPGGTSFGPSRADQIRALGKTNSTTPFTSTVSSPISEQFKQGVHDIKDAGNEIGHGEDIVPAVESGLKAESGVASVVTAPLAPIMKPVGDIVNWLGEKIGNTKAAQDFVTKHPDAANALQRIATDSANAGNVASTIAGVEGAIKGAPKVVDAAKGISDSLKVDPIEAAKQDAVMKAEQNAKAQKTIQDTMRKTAGKYVRPSNVLREAESDHGTNPLEVISSYGKGKALPAIEKGKINPDEAIDYLKDRIGDLSDIKNDAVFLNESKIPVSDFGKYAHDLVDAQKNWSESRKVSAHEQLNKELAGIQKAYKGDLPLSEVDKIKTEQTGLSKSYNNAGAKPFELDTHGIIGKAGRDLVEMHTDDAPTKELNKLIQSHYDAVDLLDSMRGRAPHGGQLGKYAGRVGGEILGALGGSTVGHPFVGALAGRVGADMIDSVLHSKFISNPLKRMMVEKTNDIEPAVKTRMLKYIDENSPDIKDLGD